MKKFILYVLAVIVLVSVFSGSFKVKGEAKAAGSQQTIAKKLIRFHVIANSDSDKDQALKLKVRDEILKYIAPKLEQSKSIEESRKILRENDAKIKSIAKAVIEKNGYKYDVKSTLGQENFPVKTYGDITLPQGEYEAYRVIIGSGEGKNWWCVMFPPLCFVDITKGEVSYKKTDAEMKSVLSPQEFEMVHNDSGKDEIKVKFKIVEWIKGLIK